MKATAAVIAAIVAVIALLYFATTPSAPPVMTDSEVAQIETEVEATAEAWLDVWRANDCQLARSIWNPTTMAQPYAGEIGLSVDDWINQCTTTIANRAAWTGQWMDTRVRVVSRDVALFEGTYTGTFEWRDGSPASHYSTAAQTMLFERTDSGWGLTFFVNSNGPVERADEG